MGTATILGAVYDTVLMPDGKEWTVQNVTYAPLQTTADIRGSQFTQPNTNSLHALLAPTGWRVPTNDEWYAMGAALSGASWLAGSGTASSGNNVPFDGRFTGGVGAELKDPSGWPAPYNVPPYTGANGYGFSARMQDSAVQKIAIWRCYVPSPGIYSPVWFVADNSDSFLYENGWASSSAAHVRLVRDPITPFTGFKVRDRSAPIWRTIAEARVVSGGVWRRPTRIFLASGGSWREVTK